MADEPRPPPRSSSEVAFSFVQEVPQRIPRAWERAPKSPFKGRHGGRKVWKRYETLRKDLNGNNGEIASVPVLGDATNTSHSVKRLRLKGTPDNLLEGKENEPMRYLATLQDEAKGTPRRKYAPRKSLRPDRTRSQPYTADEAIAADTVASEEKVEEDSLRASQSPALEETRELLGQVEREDGALDEEHSRSRQDDDEYTENRSTHLAEAANIIGDTRSGAAFPSEDEPTIPSYEETTASGQEHKTESVSSITFQSSDDLEPRPPQPTDDVKLMKPDKDAEVSDWPTKLEFNIYYPEPALSHNAPEASDPYETTPLLASSPGVWRPKQLSETLSPEGTSPQIGTSLLRRESLRKRETPSKKRESRKTRSPKKKDTLSRRDTLQEREILQRVIAETNQEGNVDIERHEATLPTQIDLQDTDLVKETASLENVSIAGLPSGNPAPDVENFRHESSDAIVEKDLNRARKAIEVFEQPTPDQAGSLKVSNKPIPDQAGGSPLHSPVDPNEEIKAINKANEIIAEAEVEEATQSAEAVKEQPASPSKETRSGTRFSDDTSMLRDFLNRAQASKAAKTPIIAPLDAPKPQISPRRSPRKAHGSHRGTPRDIASRPGTPPGRNKPDILESDDGEEFTATPTSCRRSARTRLPAPSKAPPGAPSFIPVKRADGSDPVVLQKSQAQELAMVTRANTRRNKGQSKPPLLALKELPVDSLQLATAKQRADHGKAVGWAEKLASYHDLKEKTDEAEEIKPKVRRMRGLGATNGTPAPKKSAAAVDMLNGTPAPKRRGKVMSGK